MMPGTPGPSEAPAAPAIFSESLARKGRPAVAAKGAQLLQSRPLLGFASTTPRYSPSTFTSGSAAAWEQERRVYVTL